MRLLTACKIIGPGNGNLSAAVSHNSLEILRAHDRAKAAAAAGADIAHNARKPHQALARRPDAGNAGRLAVGRGKALQRFIGCKPPQAFGVLYFNLAVMDIEIDRACGFAGDDDAVETGILELYAEAAADISKAELVRVLQRRFARHKPAAAGNGAAARKRAGHEHERAVGMQGIHFLSSLHPSRALK